jgi:hypothetical protein
VGLNYKEYGLGADDADESHATQFRKFRLTCINIESALHIDNEFLEIKICIIDCF